MCIKNENKCLQCSLCDRSRLLSACSNEPNRSNRDYVICSHVFIYIYIEHSNKTPLTHTASAIADWNTYSYVRTQHTHTSVGSKKNARVDAEIFCSFRSMVLAFQPCSITWHLYGIPCMLYRITCGCSPIQNWFRTNFGSFTHCFACYVVMCLSIWRAISARTQLNSYISMYIIQFRCSNDKFDCLICCSLFCCVVLDVQRAAHCTHRYVYIEPMMTARTERDSLGSSFRLDRTLTHMPFAHTIKQYIYNYI